MSIRRFLMVLLATQVGSSFATVPDYSLDLLLPGSIVAGRAATTVVLPECSIETLRNLPREQKLKELENPASWSTIRSVPDLWYIDSLSPSFENNVHRYIQFIRKHPAGRLFTPTGFPDSGLEQIVYFYEILHSIFRNGGRLDSLSGFPFDAALANSLGYYPERFVKVHEDDSRREEGINLAAALLKEITVEMPPAMRDSLIKVVLMRRPGGQPSSNVEKILGRVFPGPFGSQSEIASGAVLDEQGLPRTLERYRSMVPRINP